MDQVRIRLRLIPMLLVPLVVFALYLARWTILTPVIAPMLEETVADALPGSHRVEIDGLGGTLISGVRVDNVVINARGEAMANRTRLEQVLLHDVRLSYRLSELLPWVTILLREDGGVDPAALGAQLPDALPQNLSLEAEGAITVGNQTTTVTSSLAVRAGTMTGGQLVELAIDRLSATLEDGTREQSPPLVMRAHADAGAVRVELIQSDTGTELVQAQVSAEEERSGAFHFSSFNVSTSLPGLSVSAQAGAADATATVEASDTAFTRTAQQFLTLTESPVTGSLVLSFALDRLDGAPQRPLSDRLLRAPATIPDHARATAEIRTRAVQTPGFQIDELNTSLAWRDDTLELSRFEGTGTITGLEAWIPREKPRLSATGSRISWKPTTGGFSAERVEVTLAESSLRLSGYGAFADSGNRWQESSGSVRGRLRVDPRQLLRASEAGTITGPLSFSDDARILLSFLISGAEQGPALEWTLESTGLLVGDLPTVSLDASGDAGLAGAQVRTLEITSGERTAALAGPVDVDWTAGLSLSPTVMRAGNAEVRGSFSLGDGELAGELHASRLAATRIAAAAGWQEHQTVEGSIGGTVTIRGDTAAPDASVEVTSSELQVDGVHAEIQLRLLQDARGLSIERLQIALAEIATASGAGRVPVTIGRAGLAWGTVERLQLDLQATAQLARIMGSLPGPAWQESTATLQVAADGTEATGSLVLSDLTDSNEQVVVGIESFGALELRADGALTEAGAGRMEGSVSGDGEQIARFSGSLTPDGAGDGGGLEIDAELDIPLARVSHLIPGVVFSGGTVRGELDGSEGLAGLTGTVRVSQGIAKLSSGIPALSALNGRLDLEDGTVRIRRLGARMGSRRLQVNGTADMIESGGLDLDLNVNGTNLLLYRTPNLTVRADVDADVTSADATTVVSGRLDVRDVGYSEPIQLLSLGTDAERPTRDVELFRVDEPWARTVVLDVAVIADQSIRVDNNLYRGALSADLVLGGTAAVPRASGVIFGSDGAVRLPTTTLAMNTVRVRFPENDAFAPLVEGEAQTELQGYDMSIVIDGQIPNVSVSIVSTPPLPTDEALILLTTGRRLSDLQFSNGVAAGAAGVLGRSFLRQLSDTAEGEAQQVFDRLDFAIEQDAERQGVGDISVEYQLVEDRSWFLEFKRTREEEYTVELQWNLWAE